MNMPPPHYRRTGEGTSPRTSSPVLPAKARYPFHTRHPRLRSGTYHHNPHTGSPFRHPHTPSTVIPDPDPVPRGRARQPPQPAISTYTCPHQHPRTLTSPVIPAKARYPLHTHHPRLRSGTYHHNPHTGFPISSSPYPLHRHTGPRSGTQGTGAATPSTLIPHQHPLSTTPVIPDPDPVPRGRARKPQQPSYPTNTPSPPLPSFRPPSRNPGARAGNHHNARRRQPSPYPLPRLTAPRCGTHGGARARKPTQPSSPTNTPSPPLPSFRPPSRNPGARARQPPHPPSPSSYRRKNVTPVRRVRVWPPWRAIFRGITHAGCRQRHRS